MKNVALFYPCSKSVPNAKVNIFRLIALGNIEKHRKEKVSEDVIEQGCHVSVLVRSRTWHLWLHSSGFRVKDRRCY